MSTWRQVHPSRNCRDFGWFDILGTDTKWFNGFKRHIATDLDSRLILSGAIAEPSTPQSGAPSRPGLRALALLRHLLLVLVLRVAERFGGP